MFVPHTKPITEFNTVQKPRNFPPICSLEAWPHLSARVLPESHFPRYRGEGGGALLISQLPSFLCWPPSAGASFTRSAQGRSALSPRKGEKQQPITFPWELLPDSEIPQKLRINTTLSLVTARHCLWLGPLWHKCTPMYLYIIERFQSKTIPQQMHWGRGRENKQEPDVWPVPSWTAEGSSAAQDESLQILELHKVLGGTTARCCHRTSNISLTLNGTALWGHKKKPFQVFRAQPIL